LDESTPADAQIKPWRVSAMTSGGRERTTRHRLLQDRLDPPRILVSGQLARSLGGLDVVQPHDPPLRLGHDFLREHNDVAVLELGGARNPLGKIVALPYLRPAEEREDPELRHGRPVTRRPA